MTWSQRTPDWYYGPWIEEYYPWEEASFPWLLENDQADWTPHTPPLTADWTPASSPTTGDWTPRDIPLS